MTTISVITPCFNAEKFIMACISSVAQSVTLNNYQIEHILIDDHSSDQTASLIHSLNSNAQLIELKQHQGVGAARNIGLQRATGKYVFFLDADDVLFQNSLRTLYQIAEKTGSSWITGDFIRSDEHLAYQIGNDYYGWPFSSAAELLTSMYTGQHFFQQNNLFLKALLDGVNGFQEQLTMAEDFDLCTRLALQGVVPHYLAGPLYIHRLHDQNTSNIHLHNKNQHKSDVKKLFENYQNEMKKVLSDIQFEKVKTYLMDIKV